MDSYRPFLIPLLERPNPTTRHSGENPGSPLEEEHLIGGFQGADKEVWRQLQDAVSGAFGLPLLLKLPDGCEPVDYKTDNSLKTPDRFLSLKTALGSWFLIEQPDSISLIDRHAMENQTAAIARPTLFERLWREMADRPGHEDGDPEGKENGREDEVRALEEKLTQVILDGRPSDWHLEPKRSHYCMRCRIDGQLKKETRLPLKQGEWLINSLVSVAGMETTPGTASEGQSSHLLPSGEKVSLRISIIPSRYGNAVVTRFLYHGNRSDIQLRGLGFTENATRYLESRYNGTRGGLWLVAGPTGSGKSTTLRALLGLSVKRNEKVLSVEDPVEFPMQGIHQVSVGSPRGLTWDLAVRAFLRQAPDTVLVGEIRDEATAAIALQAARTGHRILSTLHARDNCGLIRRLMDLGQRKDCLDGVCECVLHQRLLPRLCSRCRTIKELSQQEREVFRELGLQPPDGLASSQGCAACNEGIDGRIPILSFGGTEPARDTVSELSNAAWDAVCRFQVSLRDAQSHFPRSMRERFGICQA